MNFRKLLFASGKLGSVPGDIGLAVLRVFAGFSFSIAHGYGKMAPSAQFVSAVDNLGFPMPVVFAWAAALSEFIGGILVGLGLFTRIGAGFACCTMVTAAFLQHASDPYQQKELALLYLAIMFAFLIYGSGKFGVDALIEGGEGG